jgi:hypothetical protein
MVYTDYWHTVVFGYFSNDPPAKIHLAYVLGLGVSYGLLSFVFQIDPLYIGSLWLWNVLDIGPRFLAGRCDLQDVCLDILCCFHLVPRFH